MSIFSDAAHKSLCDQSALRVLKFVVRIVNRELKEDSLNDINLIITNMKLLDAFYDSVYKFNFNIMPVCPLASSSPITYQFRTAAVL